MILLISASQAARITGTNYQLICMYVYIFSISGYFFLISFILHVVAAEGASKYKFRMPSSPIFNF
jgi:hypothetical protein